MSHIISTISQSAPAPAPSSQAQYAGNLYYGNVSNNCLFLGILQSSADLQGGKLRLELAHQRDIRNGVELVNRTAILGPYRGEAKLMLGLKIHFDPHNL